jgi:hypothetical protein
MYLMLCGLVMNVTFVKFEFSVTIISLGYCYIHLDSIFTAEHVLHAWSRLVTFCHELLYILGFDLYTVCMTLVGKPNTFSQFLTLNNPWSSFEFTRSS